MKTSTLCRLGLFLSLSLFSGNLLAQKIHRYVVEVEKDPPRATRSVITKRLDGTFLIEEKPAPKIKQYWEIFSKTPLTLQQCQDSIRLGRARRTDPPGFTRLQQRMHKKDKANLTIDGDMEDIFDRDIYDGEVQHEDPDLWDFLAD